MPNNRHAREKSGHMFQHSPHDSPWEHLSVENSQLASCQHAEKETRLQSEIAGIDNALSGTASFEANLDQRTSTRWEQTPRYCESSSPMSSYSTSAHNRHNIRYENNNSQGPGYTSDNVTDAPYSSALSSHTVVTSHSSPGEMTESSSTIEASAPESPDAGASDRDRNPSSRSTAVSFPRPFSRKSKAGNPHTVTPSAAGPEGGFICKFIEHGKFCGKAFKLPSDIRLHIIEDHVDFSPFQCGKCMRIYTRKSLYTRHLKESNQEGTTRQTRQCPNQAVKPDEAFRIRKITYEALWAIQLTQEQVDNAINIIKQHNGKLPGRRRRTQNTNVPEVPCLIAAGLQVPQSVSHSYHQRDERDTTSHLASPSFGTQTTAATCPSTLLRSLSAPDLYPQARIANEYAAQSPMMDSTEARRRSPAPGFGSAPSFHNGQTYQSRQDSSSLPATQPTFHRYLEVGTPLYNPTPRNLSGLFEQPREFIEAVPTVDPHVLHQATIHRHNSWDRSGGVESNYDGHGAWTPTGARDQNYRHQMTFENDSQGYKEGYQYSATATSQSDHIQDDSFNLAPNRRRSSFQDEFRVEASKRR